MSDVSVTYDPTPDFEGQTIWGCSVITGWDLYPGGIDVIAVSIVSKTSDEADFDLTMGKASDAPEAALSDNTTN